SRYGDFGAGAIAGASASSCVSPKAARGTSHPVDPPSHSSDASHWSFPLPIVMTRSACGRIHGVVLINLSWGPHASQKIQRTGRVSIIKSWTGSLTLHASGRGISSIRADERHGRRAGSAKLRSGPRGP